MDLSGWCLLVLSLTLGFDTGHSACSEKTDHQWECDGLRDFPTDLEEPETLDLSGNMLETIASVPYPTLISLDVSRNMIISVADGAFANCTALTSLNMARNSVDDVTVGTFQGLASLSILDFSMNELK